MIRPALVTRASLLAAAALSLSSCGEAPSPQDEPFGLEYVAELWDPVGNVVPSFDGLLCGSFAIEGDGALYSTKVCEADSEATRTEAFERGFTQPAGSKLVIHPSHEPGRIILDRLAEVRQRCA